MKKLVIGVSLFVVGSCCGIFLEKYSYKKKHKNTYVGELKISKSGENHEIYLVLSVPPEKLATLEDVKLKVDAIKVK